MHVRHQLGQPPECVDQVITEANGVRRREAKTAQSRNRMNRLKQLNKWRKPLLGFREFMTPVKIHDLPEQRDLPYSATYQSFHFPHDLLDAARPFGAARAWHDAKRA